MLQSTFGVPQITAGAPFGATLPFGKTTPFATAPGTVPFGVPNTFGVPPIGTTGLPISNLGLGALPFGNAGLGALPFGNAGLGALPFSNAGLGALPFGNTGLGNLPFGNAGLGAIPPTGLGVGALPGPFAGPSVCFANPTATTTAASPLANILTVAALGNLLNQQPGLTCPIPTVQSTDGGITGTKSFCGSCHI